MRWLSAGGLVAALGTGGLVAVGLGWRGVALLLAFFVSSSLWTQAAEGSGHGRTARQVAANGGVAALAALAGDWLVTAGALAAAAADTWATEIGAFARRPPRLITTGAPVPRGMSGGITILGTAGGVAGAGFMAVVAWVLGRRGMAPGSTHPGELVALVAVAGVLGMLVDSLLGATVQALYGCPECGAQSERRGAVCHAAVRRLRGWTWLDNDAVNLAATLVGAAVVAAGSRF